MCKHCQARSQRLIRQKATCHPRLGQAQACLGAREHTIYLQDWAQTSFLRDLVQKCIKCKLTPHSAYKTVSMEKALSFSLGKVLEQ